MMHRTPLGLALATATLLGLSACGGGGSSTIATPAAPSGPTTVTTSFSGTAATGAAMAGATVSISCASGSGTATTAANGGYTKDLTDITLPCAIKAVSSDGTTTLYSVTTPTTTASTTQVANVTPLTQLLVASLAGTDPATFFTNFSTTASTVTAANISTAQTAVLTTLSNAGLNVSALTNLLTGALVPATSTSSGNAYDVVLDALKAQLTTSGTTLATLTTTVAATSPAASTTNANNSTASLPAALLLKAADTNCSALRSGDYWVFSPSMGGAIANQFTSASFDAATKTMTNLVGASTVLSANSTTCRYLAADGLSDVVVSQAGVLMARVLKNGTYRLSFAIPKQTITLAELAGTWNGLGFESNDAGTAYATNTFTATASSTGALTDVNACEGANSSATCSAVPNGQLAFTSNSAGGFDLSSKAAGDAWTDRAFAYRAGNGDLMLVEVAGDGSVSTWTQKRTLTLPAVNSTGVGNWSVRNSNALVAATVAYDTGYTVTAVDTATSSVTRQVLVAAGGSDTYTQTVVQNNPRAGYNYRGATTATSVAGTSVPVRERTSLNLRGMGVSVQSVPSQNAFQISVDQ